MREADATLEATAFQYGAASIRGHALNEAVDAGAMALLWLVGSFWHITFTLAHRLETNNWAVSAHRMRVTHYCLLFLVKITMFNHDSLSSFPRFAKYFPQFSRWDASLCIT